MRHDFEIELPNIEDYKDDDSNSLSGDKLIILPIEKYDYLMSEMGKLDALRAYLNTACKPSVVAVESMLGIRNTEGRKHD